MSLINDALKRARTAEPPKPQEPPGSAQLRPVEPVAHACLGLGLAVPVSFAAVALVALLLAWQLARNNAHRQNDSKTESTVSPTAAVSPPAPAGVVDPGVVRARELPKTNGVTASDLALAAGAETNGAAYIEPPPPKPAPLRLQAIFFNPSHPSAIISGKSVFVGDNVRDFRVVAIRKDSAMLVGAGLTNVLTIEP